MTRNAYVEMAVVEKPDTEYRLPERERVGVRRTSRKQTTPFHTGRRDLNRAGELRRKRTYVRIGQSEGMSSASRRRRSGTFSGQRVRAARPARQCVGVDARLLERQLSWSAVGRSSVGARRLWSSCGARGLLGLRSAGPALGVPLRVRHRGPLVPQRFSSCPDAHVVSRYVLTSGDQQRSPAPGVLDSEDGHTSWLASSTT